MADNYAKLYLTWDAINKRAFQAAEKVKELARLKQMSRVSIYGVPNGGIYAAQAIMRHLPGERFELVTSASAASVIVDDIVDSGATRDNYEKLYPNTPFCALVDKTAEPLKWVVFPWEAMATSDETDDNDPGPQENVRRLIQFIEGDANREGVRDTPARVIRAYKEIFAGYHQKPQDVCTVFEEPCDEMVVMKNIEFYSCCEHHMLTFSGRAHIGYIPVGKVIGASKLARILDIYARRLSIQERICREVTAALGELLSPLGSACVLEAEHLCMQCRGVQKQHSSMVTSSMTGAFKEQPATRQEFMSIIGMG